ncbi:uncharacterized protein SAMN05216249_102130 [Acetitomaculum ruminis DSM 5522]|uniref:DUF177 domain-containing protein n=1 Tax=Acetitomaculum ruminis DSM 5522 TaxID=1120918 RepID=A0A1I0VQ29_9FIRM|nr:DUF177 domain-containing protein [Acetitomaculum ruminis]SFA78401.1 uncharacterized protein SAMN05216249_102130 [Acetitomaculum ruminis DSM 5522]
MQVDVSNIISQENRNETVNAHVDIAKVSFKMGDFPIVSKEDFLLTLKHKNSHVFCVSFKVKLTIEFPCDRCLTSVDKEFFIEFDEDIDINEEDWKFCLKEKVLDLDTLIVNELIVNWPAKILCKEDCKGICPVCKVNRNKETCDCDTRVLDPRMAVIQDIFKNFKEV